MITAVDAMLAPITGVAVSAANGATLGTTDAAGTLTLSLDARARLTLTFRHPAYVAESVRFEPDAVGGKWDNALVMRAIRGSDMTLRVQLGRCATAPTAYVAETDIPGLAGDAKAALLFHPPNYPTEFAYRYHWPTDTAVRLARTELLPAKQPGPNSRGWDNFQSDDSGPVPIANAGRLFWLTYSPRAGETQYAIAVWSPTISSPATLPQLSMILFYSPSTSDYKGAYPFGLVPDPHGGPIDQPYMTLGAKYLLTVYNMAYEIAARGNPSVVVMPICRRGDWGPFASGEGAARLLAEVAVFLQRECRTSRLGSSTPAIDPLYRLAGASLRDVRTPITAADFGATPPVTSLALGFFSTGAAAAKAVMSNWALPGRFPSAYWGTAQNNAQATWDTAWREIWDMDGFHPTTGGWDSYLSLLQRWYAHDSSRSVRLCHSSGRVPRDPVTDRSPFWRDLLRDPVTFGRSWPPGSGPGWARELHNARSSVIAFADGYIAGGDADTHPVLGDAHHATCSLAFSHSIALTNVGVRHQTSFSRTEAH